MWYPPIQASILQMKVGDLVILRRGTFERIERTNERKNGRLSGKIVDI